MSLTSNLRIRRQFTQRNPQARAQSRSRELECPILGCTRTFMNNSGLTQHKSSAHPDYVDAPSSPNPINWATPSVDESPEGSGSDTSSHRPVTIEDIEDEDEIRSSSSGNAQERTSKYCHSKLNGVFQCPFVTIIC